MLLIVVVVVGPAGGSLSPQPRHCGALLLASQPAGTGVHWRHKENRGCAFMRHIVLPVPSFLAV